MDLPIEAYAGRYRAFFMRRHAAGSAAGHFAGEFGSADRRKGPEGYGGNSNLTGAETPVFCRRIGRKIVVSCALLIRCIDRGSKDILAADAAPVTPRLSLGFSGRWKTH